MQVLTWLIYAIGVIVAVGWCFGVRTYVRTGRGVQQQTVNQTLLMVVSLVLVPAAGISPLHLLWMFPAAWVIGLFSLAMPFALVTLIGRPFGNLLCLGLNQLDVEDNKRRLDRLHELVAEGVEVDEAVRIVKSELP